MTTRDQFGNYLLLKKLTEDPLGETFRAGQVGTQGMDRIVLLRVFNGPGLHGDELWDGISGRRALLELLRSPNLAEGVDTGLVHGVPYVAWDYVSGKDLRHLMDQAEKQFSPVPTDQALLIAERMALGLEVAHGTRGPDGQRVVHGFLVPHLVLVSNEGDTRLLGFEAAPALRKLALASPTANHFRPFVSSEALTAGTPQKEDDIFSLGSILFELLTGQKLPPVSAEGFGPVVDRATLADEGTALPPEIGVLVKNSLAPTGQRIADVTTWHKEISKILFEGQYNPTTFNLAFFMHNLFRDEIEKESEEIEAERTMEVPVQLPEPVAETAPAGLSSPSDDTSTFREAYGLEDEKEEKKRTGLILGVVAAAIIIAAVGYFAMRGGGGKGTTDTATTASTASVPATPAEPDPAVAELEGKMQQLQALIEQQQAMIESSQQQQDEAATAKDTRTDDFERRLVDLQTQLQTAERQKEEAVKAAEEAAVEETTAEEETVPEPIAPEPEDQVAATPDESEEATEPTEPVASNEQVAQTPPAQTPTSPVTQQPVAKPPTPTTATQPPATAPATSSSVKPGDLVEPGPGVVPPTLQRPPRPRFPAVAKRLNKKATVEVSVLVNEKGRVIDARLKAKKKAGFGFDEAALQAAREALYKPATKDGIPVKLWVELRISFQ